MQLRPGQLKTLEIKCKGRIEDVGKGGGVPVTAAHSCSLLMNLWVPRFFLIFFKKHTQVFFNIINSKLYLNSNS